MTIEQKQHLLAYLGYYKGQVGGIFGPRSEAAAADFQEDFGGIAVDGIVGPETEMALRHAVAYGMPEKNATDKNVGGTAPEPDKPMEDTTGTYWDHIRYWKREEFACRCGEYHDSYCNGFPVEPDQTLVELVDDVRHGLGVRCHRSSGIRCYQHNIDSDGVANSRHKTGKALDFRAEGRTAAQVVSYTDPRVRYVYAIDGSYVHVDVH